MSDSTAVAKVKETPIAGPPAPCHNLAILGKIGGLPLHFCSGFSGKASRFLLAPSR
jgi:hypothetical protein